MAGVDDVLLAGRDDDIALITEHEVLTFGDLTHQVQSYAATLFNAAGKQLAFCFLPNTLDLVTIYLSALASGNVAGLFSPTTPHMRKRRLIEIYRPNIVADTGAELADLLRRAGYLPVGSLNVSDNCLIWQQKSIEPLGGDLALVLSTSGSTGAPKLVRLSAGNVAASALSIVEALRISPTDSGVTSLPLYSSYGLSILNSHLAAGSAVAVTSRSPFTRKFWNFAHRWKVVEIGGTTLLYQAMYRREQVPDLPPTVKIMTHSGARLPLELARSVLAQARSASGSFFCMYGQTEATSRISSFDAAQFPDKLGSVGTVVPGGRLHVDVSAADVTDGTIYYAGPNVMMGYALDREDLVHGHEVQILDTGDRGTMDADGFLHITGRSSRFTKILDRRISLDDLEEWLGSREYSCAALTTPSGGSTIVIFTTRLTDEIKSRRDELALALGIPESHIQLRVMDTLPVTVSGKVDYAKLEDSIK